MSFCNHCQRDIGRGNRHNDNNCPKRLKSGPGGKQAWKDKTSHGNRQVRLPEPLAAEARAAVEEGLEDEAAAAIAALRKAKK